MNRYCFYILKGYCQGPGGLGRYIEPVYADTYEEATVIKTYLLANGFEVTGIVEFDDFPVNKPAPEVTRAERERK